MDLKVSKRRVFVYTDPHVSNLFVSATSKGKRVKENVKCVVRYVVSHNRDVQW